LVLLVIPWSELWERNYFAASLPFIGTFVRNNFVRGGVTGVGLLTVLAGLAELGGVLAGRSGPDETASSG
jgi:hypothetical protein